MAPFNAPVPVLSGLKERVESLTVQGASRALEQAHYAVNVLMRIQATSCTLEPQLGAFLSIKYMMEQVVCTKLQAVVTLTYTRRRLKRRAVR